MRQLRERLEDILEAVAQIETEQAKGKAAFDENPLVQVWMVHHLMIIGEAVRAIDPAERSKYPSVPWRQIAGMRNILVHDYFRIIPGDRVGNGGKASARIEDRGGTNPWPASARMNGLV